MSFSKEEIAGMLEEYEADYHTGMNINDMAQWLYNYTSGYPFLVSRLCQLMDERISQEEAYPSLSDVWTKKASRELSVCFYQKKTRCSNLCSIS